MEIARQGAEAMRRPRRNRAAAFKAKVAIAALKGEEALAALAEKFDVHLNLKCGGVNRSVFTL